MRENNSKVTAINDHLQFCHSSHSSVADDVLFTMSAVRLKFTAIKQILMFYKWLCMKELFSTIVCSFSAFFLVWQSLAQVSI
jgi:urease alpha subunit